MSAGLRWSEQLTEQQQLGVRQLLAAATTHDGVAPVGEEVLLSLRVTEPGSRHLLATDGGQLRGYAHLAAAAAGESASTPFVELAVHPESRRAGTGSALLGSALTEGGDTTRVWAHGDLPPARGLARALGLAAVRELLQLRRGLAEPLPELVVPDDLVLRPFEPGRDTDELLRVNAAAFAWHPEQGGWNRADVAERVAEPWFDADGVFLAHNRTGAGTSRLLGFHWTKEHRDVPGLAEVYVVGVDPAAQGRGLGRVLTLAGLHHLAARGMDTVLLYVEGDNAAARHTYARLGFQQAHVDVAYARA